MKSTTKAVIAAVVALAVAGGLIYWQAKASRGNALTALTAEDMSLLAESFSPQERMMLAGDDEARKKMAENVREILALAAEAREHGVADRPEVKRQMAVMRDFVLAQAYALKQREGGSAPAGPPYKKEEVEQLLADPAEQKRFEEFLSDAQKTGIMPEGELPEAQKEQIKQQWGGAQLLSRKAREAGLDKERKTQLQLALQEASLLARVYAEELAKELKPSDEEINAKLEDSRKQAGDLMQRARGGEDFEALAKEFSTEPGAKQSGGELPWFGRAVPGQPGGMVKPFEDAAFALKENEVSDIVETDFGFHVIKMLGRRTDKGPDGKPQEQVHVRHILLRPESAESNPFGPRKSLRETVADSIASERIEKKIKEIAEKSKVKVAEDFTVTAPEAPQRPPVSPHGGGGPEVTLPDDGPAPQPQPEQGGKQGQGGKQSQRK
ncbi:MAG TPA: peptidylprolyl isomerase [Pyrinomonadaceae bacterium]|nr:peptidylprolyl isomerase [Pyrinomonadaceae bacterium]